MGQDSGYEEPFGIPTIFTDGIAEANVENGVLRLTYFEFQKIRGISQKVAVARVLIALGGVLESRAAITEALKMSLTPGRRHTPRDISDLLIN